MCVGAREERCITVCSHARIVEELYQKERSQKEKQEFIDIRRKEKGTTVVQTS